MNNFLKYTGLLLVGLIIIIFSLRQVQRPLDDVTINQSLDWEDTFDQQITENNTNNLFNVTEFKYILSPERCENNTQLIIIVTSYYGNIEARHVMRKTFDSVYLKQERIKRVFLLGEAVGDKYTNQLQINDEAKKFGDLVQGNFAEHYRNLTYKHVMGLKWTSEHCGNAKFLVKVDDDTVMDIRSLLNLIRTENGVPKNTLAGYVLKNMVPIREPANKWFVTLNEYKFNTYPTFLSGWFYITTPEIAKKMYFLSLITPYFWIDDVYVSGILARKLRLRHFDLSRVFTVHPEELRCCIEGARKNFDCDIWAGPNGGDVNLYYMFGESMKGCRLGGCEKRVKPLNETCVAERKVNIGRGVGVVKNFLL